MTRKEILVKAITTGLSLLTSVSAGLYVLTWDTHNSLDVLNASYSVIWDYQVVRVYILISASLFASLNVFRQIEILFSRPIKSISNSNIGGIYSYVLGTIIYAIFIQFVFDFRLRVLGLVIPIILTTIGFNLNIVKDTKELARKKVLILANIVLLIFWSATAIYIYVDLEYKRKGFEEAKSYFKELDSKYLKHGDSLRNVFDTHGFNFKLLKQLKNDTLESLVIEQMKLYSEFSKYREMNDYALHAHLNYIYNYEELRTMILVGLISVLFINGIYLTYLYRDKKATTANKVHVP
jgi:hypothetical protein